MKKQERISKILKILIRKYGSYKKPTVRATSRQKDAFKTLVACLLSLRTTDENTARAAASLFSVASTPRQIAKLPIKKLEKLIYCSGYYKNKAKTIKHVAKVLLKKYNGKVPSTREELLSIKGIGPKTAAIVLGFAFGKKVIPVDVHVHTIANRLGFVRTKKPEQTESELMKVVPQKYWRELNTTFVLFGKEICKSVPICSKCPVCKLCPRIGVKKRK